MGATLLKTGIAWEHGQCTRMKAAGRRVVTVPIILFSDDYGATLLKMELHGSMDNAQG